MCLVYKNVLQYIYMYKCVYVYIIYMYMYWNMYVRKTDDGFYIYHISKNKKIYSGTKCVDMDDIYIYILILI